MPEPTVTVSVDRLYVPRWIAPEAHAAVQALVLDGCDGGDGEYDELADTILRKMFSQIEKALSSNPIHEWEALSVTSEERFVVFQELRIEFALTPHIKRCYVCKRVMAEHECGDVFDEERVCDTCSAAAYEDQVALHLNRYLTNRHKRTGRYWAVVERYVTAHRNHRAITWQRALIESDDGERVRIYYRFSSRCWVVS